MQKRPTIYDVAALAGVSIGTVSFAFQRPDRVSDATRAAVLQAATELSYVPSASARGLARGRTGILGLCSYDYLEFSAAGDFGAAGRSTPTARAHDLRQYPIFIDEVQRGMQLESWHAGYALLVRSGNSGSTRAENEAAMTDLASRVDGLAAFPGTVPMDVLLTLSRRIPIVALSEAPDEPTSLSCVTVDNRAAMRGLTEHLLTAHRLSELVFVGSGSVDIDRRFAGFCDALRSAGHTVPPEPLGGNGNSPHAHQVSPIIGDLLAGGDLPQAFVCGTDQHAVVVLDLLQQAGIAVPEQVAVTGFDGLLISEHVRPTLTTVRQPMQDMGAAAVQLILDSLVGTAPTPLRRTFDTTLVLGQSCGC